MQYFGKYNIRCGDMTNEEKKKRFSNLKRRFMNSQLNGSVSMQDIYGEFDGSKNETLTSIDCITTEKKKSFIFNEEIKKTKIENEKVMENKNINEFVTNDRTKSRYESKIKTKNTNENENKTNDDEYFKNTDNIMNERENDGIYNSGLLMDYFDDSYLSKNKTKGMLSILINDNILDDLREEEENKHETISIEDTQINQTDGKNVNSENNNKNNFLKEIKNLEIMFFQKKDQIIKKYEKLCESELIDKIKSNVINFQIRMIDKPVIKYEKDIDNKRIDSQYECNNNVDNKSNNNKKQNLSTFKKCKHKLLNKNNQMNFVNSEQVFTETELATMINHCRVNFKKMPRNPVKIAEASFSEVFNVAGLIYKIIPFNSNYTEHNFLKEIAAMIGLRNNEGVCQIIDFFIIVGAYDKDYIKAWDLFKNTENADPRTYKDTQQYGCIVMEDCGKDLESHVFKNGNEITFFFMNFVKILWKLQEKYKFEHRDMHWGNILVKKDKIYILDYSFCRLELSEKDILANLKKLNKKSSFEIRPDNLENESEDIRKIIFTDLSKEEWLFTGNGKVDPQFSVYKKMKLIANNEWQTFNSGSNGLWCGYLIKKLYKKCYKLGSREEIIAAIQKLKKIEAVFKKCKWDLSFYDWINAEYEKYNFFVN